MIKCINSKQNGFTLIELMITVAIIGILATIAYPNYQRYVIKSKRTDMMSEMHNIASEIQSQKLAQGNYSNVITTGLNGNYPAQGALYTVTIGNVAGVTGRSDLTSKWQIIATPKIGTQMAGDGTLTLDYQGIKCRAALCGSGNEWN
ncbi:type IV pilin protein [Psychrobacter sp. GP33]|uniref:type IV pilin protein n=1 Tax=Psychrobacter sp. GP33 TaxID=2758709 RepID=UPI0015FE1491|nr:prepilin-type N-terminal cleavage/methylation domain-containing protein [Psychrobacter sp. GP33]